MINVNAWTSYSERIGDEYYFVTEDGNKNYRVEITKRNSIASRFCTYGNLEDVEKFENQKGLLIAVYGKNNSINIGKVFSGGC